MLCRMLSRIRGLYPLDSSSTPPVMTSINVSRHCQMSIVGGELSHVENQLFSSNEPGFRFSSCRALSGPNMSQELVTACFRKPTASASFIDSRLLWYILGTRRYVPCFEAQLSPVGFLL